MTGNPDPQVVRAGPEPLQRPAGLAVGDGVDLTFQLTAMIVFGDAGEFLDKVPPRAAPERRLTISHAAQQFQT